MGKLTEIVAMRLDKVRRAMVEKGVEYLLVSNITNVRYLSGFTGEDTCLLVGLTEQILFTDFRFLEQVEKECCGFEFEDHRGELSRRLADILRARGATRLGVEGDSISRNMFDKLAKALDGVELAPMQRLVEGVRSRKEPGEIEKIRRAIGISEGALKSLLPQIKPGITEKELADELEYQLRRRGADKGAFGHIIASGAHASLPHYIPGRHGILNNTGLLVDWGAIFQQYCCDMTRTFLLGKCDPYWEEIYEVVLEAQARAIEGIRPGRSAKEVDALARDFIKERGFGERFGHGLGHGVGMEAHEPPSISQKSEDVLQEGMTFTVEPAIYIPGQGGVRIEDVVLVTEHGCEVMSSFPKGLADTCLV